MWRAWIAAAAVWAALPAFSATYLVNTPKYTSIQNPTLSCTKGECAPYVSGMSVTGVFVTKEPLPPNASNLNALPYLRSYSLNDGLTTYVNDDPQVHTVGWWVWTDAEGNVTTWSFWTWRWQRPGTHSLADRADALLIDSVSTRAEHNRACQQIAGEQCYNFPLVDGWSSLGTAGGSPLVRAASPTTPVYRFYNPVTRSHFFTASVKERDHVIDTMPVFGYEGTAFYAFDREAGGAEPVYRFYNSGTGAHFYTMNEFERDYIASTMKAFHYEGPSWYGLPAESPQTEAKPVHRFYRPATGTHFYTINAFEMEYIRAHDKSFNYEGVAYWAWETPR